MKLFLMVISLVAVEMWGLYAVLKSFELSHGAVECSAFAGRFPSWFCFFCVVLNSLFIAGVKGFLRGPGVQPPRRFYDRTVFLAAHVLFLAAGIIIAAAAHAHGLYWPWLIVVFQCLFILCNTRAWRLNAPPD